MQIRSVALLGAGAVGSYVIWGLTERENLRFGIVAEGARAERLARDGCAINGETDRPVVWTPQQAQVSQPANWTRRTGPSNAFLLR